MACNIILSSGEPYGRNFKQQQPQALQQMLQVEIRPGVLHTVVTPVQKKQQHAVCRNKAAHAARPGSAPPAACSSQRPHQHQHQHQQQQQPPQLLSSAAAKPYERQALEVLPELPGLEEQMRQLLRRRAAVHVKEKTVLLGAFAKVLGRHSAADVSVSDKVSLAQFLQAWQLLGLQVSARHATAVFNKYGQDVRGRMPAVVFVEALVVGGPRQLMLMDGATVQQGPYKAGQPATHTGKILYPQCKGGVWPPSDWDAKLADRSSQLPEAQLELEFVYGVDRCRATSSNIAVNCQGRLVSYAAAVCFVYDHASHSQAFFRGHDDDICCLGLEPDRRIAASGQLGRAAKVLVWDSVRLVQLAKLQHGPGSRGIQALCFSSSGSKLATIATDNSHSITIWDWSRGTKLMEQKTQPGAPPAVYGVVWSRFQPDRLVSFGHHHVKFWNLVGQKKGSQSSPGLSATVGSGVFGKGAAHSVLCAVFLPNGTVLTGAPDGSICSWSGARCVRRTPAHSAQGQQGPEGVLRSSGACSHGGLSCLVLMECGKALISGGADGHVLKWDVSQGDLGCCLQRLPLMTPQAMQQQQVLDAHFPLPAAIMALDTVPGSSDVFIAGTAAGDVWEVDGDPRILLHGQQGEMLGVATNPHYPHVFAAISSAGKVAVWNAVTHKPIRIFPVGGTHMFATAVCFSPDGLKLLVGLNNGGLKEFSFSPDTMQVFWCKAFVSRVDVVRYSPDGSHFAAAGHDRAIDIFVRRGLRQQQQQDHHPRSCSSNDGIGGVSDWVRVVRCMGHSCAVKHLDWSIDGCCLQSMDQAYELLYFDAKSGQQLKGSCRDVQWASCSCCLGFPVMGIHPPDSDGTDINALDKSPGGDLLLTADDKGKVKLFNYPCVVEDAPGHCYGGHSSHVLGIRWAANQAYAVSSGGNDRAVFQWRLVLPPGRDERRKQLLQQQQVVLQAASPDGVVYGLPS